MSQTNRSIDSNRSAGSGARRGAQVLERLRENPPTIWYRGEQVRDVTDASGAARRRQYIGAPL